VNVDKDSQPGVLRKGVRRKISGITIDCSSPSLNRAGVSPPGDSLIYGCVAASGIDKLTQVYILELLPGIEHSKSWGCWNYDKLH